MLYEWDKATIDSAPTASVHAKCAVAEGALAFVTRAKLTEAAMERNMVIGILIRGDTYHLSSRGTSPHLSPQSSFVKYDWAPVIGSIPLRMKFWS